MLITVFCFKHQFMKIQKNLMKKSRRTRLEIGDEISNQIEMFEVSAKKMKNKISSHIHNLDQLLRSEAE